MNRLELCVYATLFVYRPMNGNTLLYTRSCISIIELS